MKTLTADIYTYKVPMSQSLVEDAANLVQLLQDEATTAMAIDEDAAFLTGDGAGKPMGILPGSANALTLTEVLTGSSGVLTADGLLGVRRGINSQYRKTAVWVGNSATFGLAEKLKDSQNRYLFDIQKSDVSIGDDMMLLRRRVFESEALPDVATGTYPIIFGDMSGYSIVERSGMTIMRMQDSNTGINKVEYHFRRRVGGRVTAPWKFAVQKVT
jgi:HK97 family phage major capsid protein